MILSARPFVRLGNVYAAASKMPSARVAALRLNTNDDGAKVSFYGKEFSVGMNIEFRDGEEESARLLSPSIDLDVCQS